MEASSLEARVAYRTVGAEEAIIKNRPLLLFETPFPTAHISIPGTHTTPRVNPTKGLRAQHIRSFS